MQIRPFALERYFAKYEFQVRHLLSASDCEGVTLQGLLAMADQEGRRLWDDLTLRYTESQGHPLLRQEIAALYQTISPEETLVAVPEEAIFIAMNTLLSPGDHVIVTFPGYQSLYGLAEALGCQVTRWMLKPAGGGWDLDLEVLRDNIRPNTRLLVVNFPHNPTGYLPTRARLDDIIQIAGQHGVYLFSDEMYRLLEYDVAERLPSVADLYARGVALSGLSKTFGLPGLRVGWLATRDRELLAGCAAFKDYTTICSSAPSEILGIIALRARSAIIQRNLAIVRENLSAAGRFFSAHRALFDWIPPQAGSVAFPRLVAEQPVAEFSHEVVNATNVMILPGDVFEYGGNHFRVGLGRRDFPAALELLDAYLEGAATGQRSRAD